VEAGGGVLLDAEAEAAGVARRFPARLRRFLEVTLAVVLVELSQDRPFFGWRAPE